MNQTTDLYYQEFSMQRILTALCSPELPALRGTFRPKEGFEAGLATLVKAGCREDLLFDSIAFAKRLPELYKPASAKTLKTIRTSADSFLAALNTHFPAIELSVVLENGELRKNGPISGDFHLAAATEHDIRHIMRAAAFLEKIVAKGEKIPHKPFIQQVAYLWPVFYVKSVTGKPHYEEIATLLQSAGFGQKQPEQLSKAEKNVREKVPAAEQWLVAVLPRLPGEIR